MLRGKPVDRVPVVCRIDLWHRARLAADTLPATLRGKTLEQIQLEQGMAVSARKAYVFQSRFSGGVLFHRERRGDEIVETWRTARGRLQRVSRYGPGDEARGIVPRIVRYPVQSPDDYAAYGCLMQRLLFEPDYEAYRQYDRATGEDGLPLVILGAIPVHDMMIKWVGYEQFFYHLADWPDAVEEAVETAHAAHRKMWDLVAGSPCELVMHGVNFNSQVTSPPLFRAYFLPYLQSFNRLMHQAGKRTAFHGDGDQSLLLDLVREAEFDVADCLATAPLVPLTLDSAMSAWGRDMVIWGGVPSPILEPSTPAPAFERHLDEIHRATERHPDVRFIAGVSDQAMPAAEWDRIASLAARFAGPG